MTGRRISSATDLSKYLSGDQIECLICGRLFNQLSNHLIRAHGVSCAEYRERYGIPATAPLAGQHTRQLHAEKMQRMRAEGVIVPDLNAATQAARTAGRGVRADWEREQQAQRARSLQHKTLPSGATRADGRDADRAREYQREYRVRRAERRVCARR